jgi:hypothetical protein
MPVVLHGVLLYGPGDALSKHGAMGEAGRRPGRGEDLLLACRFADSDGTVENRQAVVLSASRLSC